jgi:hypothetical protein
MVIIPEECFADLGVSIKVFMPFLCNKLLMLDCKVFCLRKFARLHADRLPQNDIALNDKYSFSVPKLHMDVDWGVVVAVEEESESIFGEYSRHCIFVR